MVTYRDGRPATPQSRSTGEIPPPGALFTNAGAPMTWERLGDLAIEAAVDEHERTLGIIVICRPFGTLAHCANFALYGSTTCSRHQPGQPSVEQA